jgi:putative hydrolase of the HAD superfamily
VAARRMTGVRAVAFDLFGTLVYEFPRKDWDAWLDTTAAIVEADPEAFHAAWAATAVERQTGALGNIEENLRTVAARAGTWPTESQIAEALEARAAMYPQWFVPRPGAQEVLPELRAAGYGLALISMCAPDAPAMWRASPLSGSVDAEVFSSEVALRKPDQAIYRLAAERLGVDAEGCLYVGDGAYRELTGAAAAGMRPVLIRDPDEEAEMLRPDPDDWDAETIGDLREIPGLLADTRA